MQRQLKLKRNSSRYRSMTSRLRSKKWSRSAHQPSLSRSGSLASRLSSWGKRLNSLQMRNETNSPLWPSSSMMQKINWVRKWRTTRRSWLKRIDRSRSLRASETLSLRRCRVQLLRKKLGTRRWCPTFTSQRWAPAFLKPPQAVSRQWTSSSRVYCKELQPCKSELWKCVHRRGTVLVPLIEAIGLVLCQASCRKVLKWWPIGSGLTTPSKRKASIRPSWLTQSTITSCHTKTTTWQSSLQ